MKDCLLLALRCLLFLLQKVRNLERIQKRQEEKIRELEEEVSNLKFVLEVDE